MHLRYYSFVRCTADAEAWGASPNRLAVLFRRRDLFAPGERSSGSTDPIPEPRFHLTSYGRKI
jgi:hypothetical protein